MISSCSRLLLLLLVLLASAGVTVQAQSVQDEIDAITERIVAKLRAGQDSEADLARELNDISDLQNKYRSQKSTAAEILLYRALVYERFIKDREMALILYEQVAAEFPGTPAGRVAAETVEAARATADDAPPRSRPSPRSRPESSGANAGQPRTMSARSSGTPAVGEMFPDFSVQDLDGAPLSVSQFRGKVVLVDFWATWCGPCVQEMPNVMAAYRDYHDEGFEIIGISLDRARAPLVNFIRQRTITWPQHFDEGGRLANRYGIRSIPSTFLLDREGKVVATNLRGAALDRALARQFEN